MIVTATLPFETTAPDVPLVALRKGIQRTLLANPALVRMLSINEPLNEQSVMYRMARETVRIPSVTFYDFGTRGRLVPFHDRRLTVDCWAERLADAELVAALVERQLDQAPIDLTEGMRVAFSEVTADRDSIVSEGAPWPARPSSSEFWPVASIATSLTPSLNANLKFNAAKAGADANAITIQLKNNGASKPLLVTVSGDAISVQLKTNSGSVILSTAAEVRDALYAHPQARGMLYAVLATGEDGTGVVSATSASTLSGGSDTGVATDVGYLGEENLGWRVESTGVPLTAAQLGTIPLDEVVTGGSMTFTLPFKEISLDNLRTAIPNAVLLEGTSGRRRLDFLSRVGQSMRRLAVKMEVRKIIGGVESAAPEDIIVFPEISPGAGASEFTYRPNTQRVINATFRAGPDAATGRWAFMGDDVV